MKYKLIQKPNPRELKSQRKWYASPVKEGTINHYQLSKDIASKSSYLTRSAVMNVLENMVREIPHYLIEGYSVNLNDLGTLRLSFSNEGADDPQEFSIENIKSVRVIFTPSPKFKRTLSNVQYEKAE
ncbi:MAG: HU family DNA-binding protein [Proteiniphilum sp.]|jgi:predicted histone-like DNA-binding protein|uniref:HU family DNA-binding protein n=1 Tax=Proteiniphilum sp. TaxID=1926877 RepID=UPI0009288811|nr:HU family DNA-binding protein [Proteiniphilum sp.]MEA5126879.1 HU family DNA-binding protein [Proteiniphilum sp.]OJV81676.1 MAG: DNA-binding protein [Bacteroidia bacterium 44-10]